MKYYLSIAIAVIVILSLRTTVVRAEESATSEIYRIGIFRVTPSAEQSQLADTLEHIASLAPLPIDIEILRPDKYTDGPDRQKAVIPPDFYTTRQALESLKATSGAGINSEVSANGVRLTVGAIDENSNILNAKVGKDCRVRGNMADVIRWLQDNVPGFSVEHGLSGMDRSTQALDLVIAPSMTVRDVLTAACRLTESRWTAEVYEKRVTKNWSYVDSNGVKRDLGPIRSPAAKISVNTKIVRKRDFVMKIGDVQEQPAE